MSFPRRHRPLSRRGIGATLFAAAVAVVCAPAPAHAGDYRVPYCGPGAPPAPLAEWSIYVRAQMSGVYPKESCAQGGNLSIEAAPGTQAGEGHIAWQLVAPSGLTIADWDAELTVNSEAPNYYAGIELTTAPDRGAGRGGAACGPGFSPSNCGNRVLTMPRKIEPGATTAQLIVGCYRDDPPLQQCNGAIAARLSRNILVFRDEVAPTGKASGGALVSSGFGSPVSGTATADVSATDFGSGVNRFEARIDGKPVGSTPAQCAEPFLRARPCPDALAATIGADTTGIPDGTHALQIVAIDASGAEGAIFDGQVVTANGGPIGPGGDANLRGAANGSHGADDGIITAGWPATARAASKSKAVKRRCAKSAAYRRKHKVACGGRPASTSLGTVRFSKKKANLVRGVLRTADGQPIAGATVAIVASSAGRSSQVAAPVTDARGAFSARIPVALGSASYAVRWMARVRDTVPAASVALRRSVRAASTLKVSRRARAGGRLEFSGRLLGAAGSQANVPVLIQVNAGSGWRAATTIQAKGDGKWRGRYSVPRQLRGTYRFRAVVKATTRYPYATAATTSRRVTIR